MRRRGALASVRAVTTWGVTVRVGLVAAAALVGPACSGDDGDAATTSTERTTSSSTSTTVTAPERPSSTTTTAYHPAAVEGQVEAAYLRSWDVYAEAVYNLQLDEEALAEVYAGDALETVGSEIRRRIEERRASYVYVEHDYVVAVASGSSANVVDTLVNHQIIIDAETKEPLEADPNEQQLFNFKLELIEDAWKVTLIERVAS